MTQFNAPMRRAGAGIDVYTGLLFVAVLVLLAGVALLSLRNLDHSKVGSNPGGIIKLID